MLVIMAFACISATGNWEGKCSGSGNTINFEMDLKDKGGDITGDAEFKESGYFFSGRVEGDREGKELDLDFEVSASGYKVSFPMKGEIDGDEMEIEIKLSGYSIDCDLKLD